MDPGEECFIVQMALGYLETPFADLSSLINRLIELHADDQHNKLDNINEVRRGVNHWANIAHRFLALDFSLSSEELEAEIIKIYIDSSLKKEIREDTKLMMAPYISPNYDESL